jgi:hypothetical protein
VKQDIVANTIVKQPLRMLIYTLRWAEPVVENALGKIKRRNMPRNLKTLAQLQTEINKLKSENVHLRTLLRVILDTAHQAVNGPEEEEESHE